MVAFALHQRYHLQHSADLTTEQITALTQVYLPIIGHDAFVLYMYWQTSPHSTELRNHTQLMNMTNLGLKTFENSRHQLEGLGLIKTYEQPLSAETQWTYVLQNPMTMTQFLSDRLLTSLLTHYIGEAAVTQLVTTAQMQAVEPAGKNVSRSFFDIIGDNAFTPLSQAPLVHQPTPTLTKVSQSDQLDLKLMAQMLSSFSVSMAELKAKESELLIEKKLYGLTDTDLVRLIQQHVNLDKTIDITNLRKTLQKTVTAQQKKPLQQPSPASTSGSSGIEQAKTTPKTASDMLMQQVRTASPITFLQALRQRNNGFITDAEVKLLNDIAQLNTLPSEVINVLLFELTVTQKKTTINRNYMQAIVNDWAQAQIKDAPAAFEYLKARSSKQREQTQKPKTYYNQPNRRHVQEQRPDWEKQTVAKVSNADKEAAAKLLAEFGSETKE
ncbi:DnaD domain protein [Weissella tructae]|uniref:DnaB protein n=1 Tax=Weissella tructae TaxID=887702 RepID=A0ABN4DGQ4_9LACO|nr:MULTISPECIES: DnaD domain protein [Weissella]AIG65443.1 DnaB protein [Weissella tructae]AIM64092.1 DnaB protein [Weissella ceti]ELA07097.1 replicative DNA helicase loader DnaB [Weissella ceti NC36]QVV91818.1 DnaD domain protein [Weissella tructae]